jgi:hypothetical protein
MSLGIVVKGTEGVVLAADSRVTVQAEQQLPGGRRRPFAVNYDNAKKIITFSDDNHSHVGAITFGDALIGRRTAHSFVPELEISLPDERLDTSEYAEHLGNFYLEQWNERMPPADEHQGSGMTFFVAGYDEGEAYGRVFSFNIPYHTEPEEQSIDEFGISYGGEAQIVNRLVKGVDPQIVSAVNRHSSLDVNDIRHIVEQEGLTYSFPYEILPLQDCIDLAILMVRTTIDVQQLAIGVRGVGGKIEAATITRTEGLNFIQRKMLTGEILENHGND